MSDARSQMTDVRKQKPDDRRQTPDDRKQKLDVRCPRTKDSPLPSRAMTRHAASRGQIHIPNWPRLDFFRLELSALFYRTLIAQHSTYRYPATGIRYPVSSIQYPVPSNPSPASSIQHPASENLKNGRSNP